jgi:hypothetical protein
MARIDDAAWLYRTYYQETLKVYARVWDIYIKFYTVFLTANVLGLGLVAEHIHVHRWPITVAFSVQNLITIGTSIGMARYSVETDKRLRQVADYIAKSDSAPPSIPEVVKGSPVATGLSQWAGYANCAATACLIFCWIAVNFIP